MSASNSARKALPVRRESFTARSLIGQNARAQRIATGTVAALALWAAAAIRNQYLKQPGPLVDA